MAGKAHLHWPKPIIIVVIILLCVLVLALIVGLVWNYRLEKRPENIIFQHGSLPTPALDGFYKGNTQTKTDWQGKQFDQAHQNGINVFNDGQRYRFTTNSSSGHHPVLRLNYNHAGNPLWLRFIVDELVQTSPGQYQGKVYVRMLPGVRFTLTYFELSRP